MHVIALAMLQSEVQFLMAVQAAQADSRIELQRARFSKVAAEVITPKFDFHIYIFLMP